MNVIQATYEPLYNLLGGDPALLNLFGWVAFIIVWYFLLSGALLYTDITGRPRWMLKYKVQSGQNPPIDMSKLWRAVKTVCFNVVFLNLLLFYPLHLFQLYTGMRYHLHDMPSLLEIILDFIGIIVVQEIVFYYSHRLFHQPWVYKHVHKQHHEWTAPIGLIATYAHPAEYMTGNGMSVFLGPVLMRSHVFTVWLWYWLAATVTIIHHSGYHLPFLPSPQFHDYHHAKFRWNFGTLGILDKLHGTDGDFRGSVHSRRHRTLWGLTPIHEKYPQAEKSKPH